VRKKTSYICDFCHTHHDTAEQCGECEMECVKINLELNDFKSRRMKVDDKHSIFHAKSSDDLDNYIRSEGSYVDDFEYKDYEYPCRVIFYEYLEVDPWDEGYSHYIHVERLDDFIAKLNEYI